MLGQIGKLCVQLAVEQASFVRVNTDGRIDEWMFVGQSKGGGVRVCGCFAVSHAHDYLDSGCERSLEDRFTVGVELRSFDVRV